MDEREKTFNMVFDPEERTSRLAASKTFFTEPSGFKFLDDHYGLRPGCLHALQGASGRGKSTLVQSLLLGWARKRSTLVYLSEESFEQLETRLMEKDIDADVISPNAHLVHEEHLKQRVKTPDVGGFLRELEYKIDRVKPEVFLIDNISTCLYYAEHFKNNSSLLSGLRKLAQTYKLSVFIVTHTKKGASEARGPIHMDDVRGSNLLPMMSDYFYTFQRYRHTDAEKVARDAAFVYVNKAREHDNHDHIYRLNYDKHQKRYTGDFEVSFETFKSFIKTRDKL